MPAQQRVRLDNEECRPPGTDAVGQEHQQRAVGARAAGPLNTAAEDGELVAEERVLGRERGLAPRQVGERADGKRRAHRAGGGQEALAEAVRGSAADRDQAVQQADRLWTIPSFVDGIVQGGRDCSRGPVPRIERRIARNADTGCQSDCSDGLLGQDSGWWPAPCQTNNPVSNCSPSPRATVSARAMAPTSDSGRRPAESSAVARYSGTMIRR